VAAACEKQGSILVVISQTRDNIDAGLFGEKQTRSGGRALRFYADTEIWTKLGRTINSTVKVAGKEKKVPIGSVVRVTVKKNRLNGRQRTVEIPIYYDHGFDDVGSCVDYLVEWGWWAKAGGGYVQAKLDSVDWSAKSQRESLIQQVIEDGVQEELSEEVAKCWHHIEKQTGVKRERRYE